MAAGAALQESGGRGGAGPVARQLRHDFSAGPVGWVHAALPGPGGAGDSAGGDSGDAAGGAGEAAAGGSGARSDESAEVSRHAAGGGADPAVQAVRRVSLSVVDRGGRVRRPFANGYASAPGLLLGGESEFARRPARHERDRDGL